MEGDKSVFLKGVRLKTTKKMRERENLLRRMNERFETLEILGMIKGGLGECCTKTDELLCDAAEILAECPEGKPSEREKELLEQKYKVISQKVEDQKKKRLRRILEEHAKREAAEREKELLEQKVKELQEQLEDQERVSEEFRVKKTEKRREREKTSADLLGAEIMKFLELKVKEMEQKVEDQERTFERFRVKLTKEMREKDDLLRKMNEKIQMLERLLRLPEKLEEHNMKKEKQQKSGNQKRVFEILRVKMREELNGRKKASAEEHIKREAAEKEKESLEKQVEELQQNLEDQERVFQRLRAEMTEEMRESEKASAEEQVKREAPERKKKLLGQKLKEFQQKVQMTEEVRERDKFLRKMNERIEMLVAVVNNDNNKDNEENTGKD
ncbi:hypothetical protein FD755_022131 [Muntiacus reevesi]|uniref:Uncharacterized protein n=1 Tax=Muntiacus reevesi TaxID=9886 RepID=A0A5N3W214_MUNRE|nr:hypothetical protein FD755_022131 [Muntiacus reevesi]